MYSVNIVLIVTFYIVWGVQQCTHYVKKWQKQTNLLHTLHYHLDSATMHLSAVVFGVVLICNG